MPQQNAKLKGGGRNSGFGIDFDPTLTPRNLFPEDLTGKGTRGDPSGKPVKINPNEVENLAVQFDTHGYNLSDADWARRFPLLPQGREFNIADSQNQLAGGEGVQIQSALNQSGLGDINFSGVNEAQKARNMGVPIADLQNRDRRYFSRLLADNPQRQFGLTGQDIAHIALANTNGQNVYNQGTYGLRVQSAIAQTQQASQNEAALIGGLASIAGAGIRSYNPYLSASGYGTPPPQGDLSGAGLMTSGRGY